MEERLIPAAGWSFIAQWCAPFRLQQAGKIASPLDVRASSGEISGRLKRRSRAMLRRRRTVSL
jgi:hypothetical protein